MHSTINEAFLPDWHDCNMNAAEYCQIDYKFENAGNIRETKGD
jgi:hypothetical protein